MKAFKGVPDYVVQIGNRGGRGVLVGNVILTAAHCVKCGIDGTMTLDDYNLERIKSPAANLLASIIAIEPVRDIAVLGAPDDQALPEEAEAFEQFCETTEPVRISRARIKDREELQVKILNRDGAWVDGVAQLFGETSPSLSIDADRKIVGGASGGPIVDMRGELVALVSHFTVPSRSLKSCGHAPRPLLALPVWVCRRFLGGVK